MKLKKLMAAVLAAVMAAGILSGCVGGAGGSGSNASLNSGEVNRLLESVKEEDQEIQVNPLPELDTALEETTAETAVNEWNVIKVNALVSQKMGWPALNRQGLTFVVSEEKLNKGLIMGDIAEILSKLGINNFGNTEKVNNLGEIDTPEKLSAALVLVAESLYGSIPFVDSEYSVSARRTEAEDGTMYWVVAVQVKTTLNP